MDLADIRVQVRSIIGETSTYTDFFTDVDVDHAINEAQRRFCSEEKWPFLLTEWESDLVEGTDTLDLPSDVSLTRVFNIAIDGSNLSQPRMLVRVDGNEGFRLRHLYTNHYGTPQWYYIANSNLKDDEAPPVTYTARVIPTPDADYTVEAQYMAVPATLSGPADEPMVPTEYQQAIVAWAAGTLFLNEQQISQKASEQFGIYAKVLETARNDLKSFSLDEIVAWGRQEPLAGFWGRTMDPRFRTPPTLG